MYSFDELCAAYGKSPRQMQRYFRTRFGCTPGAFLREERLQAAYRLLRSGVSEEEVAHSVGFRQKAQFAREFRVRFGLLPSALQTLPPPAASEAGGDKAELPAPYWKPVVARLELLSAVGLRHRW